MMTIKQFSNETGVPAHSLRRLQSAGKLMPMHITSGGHRRYDKSQIEDAKVFIRRMKLLTGGCNVVSGGSKMTPFFAYLLGLIMADGNVLESGQVQLELKDEQLIADVAKELNVQYHPRPDRNMFRMTVPRPIANKLVENGVCRRKSKGFDILPMGEENFWDYLRGLFDGDGSVSIREGRRTLRFHGHPRAMAYIQATLMQEFGYYLPWVRDNRIESGMLETSRKKIVDEISNMMYSGGISLNRKRNALYSDGEG